MFSNSSYLLVAEQDVQEAGDIRRRGLLQVLSPGEPDPAKAIRSFF